MTELRVELPDELVERIAVRAAELVAARTSTGNGGWLRGAAAIADYIGAPRSRVYGLAGCHPPRIPVQRDGANLLARRADLDRWIESGGGVRP